MSIPQGGISRGSPTPDGSSSPRVDKSKPADQRLAELILSNVKDQIEAKEGQNGSSLKDMELVLTNDMAELLSAVGRESLEEINKRFQEIRDFIK